MVGPERPPYYVVKRTMMNLREKSLDMSKQLRKSEESLQVGPTAGQDTGGGPNPASGSLQLERIRQERSGISLSRQITTGTWNVQGMTQGKMTVVEREMEICGLAVMGIAEHWWLGQGRFSTEVRVCIQGRRLGVNESVITLRVNAKPVNITFVQVYAPTGASSEEEITSFHCWTRWSKWDSFPVNIIQLIANLFKIDRAWSDARLRNITRVVQHLF